MAVSISRTEIKSIITETEENMAKAMRGREERTVVLKNSDETGRNEMCKKEQKR